MKLSRTFFCGMIVFGLLLVRPLGVFADEHGGQEHGGTATAPSEGDPNTTLKEAATALEATDPALAAELKAWAEGMGMGDKKATLAKAAAALETIDPSLSTELGAMASKEEVSEE